MWMQVNSFICRKLFLSDCRFHYLKPSISNNTESVKLLAIKLGVEEWVMCKQNTWGWLTWDFFVLYFKWIILKRIWWFYRKKYTQSTQDGNSDKGQIILMRRRHNGEWNVRNLCTCQRALEPTHLKSSPLFLFNKIVWLRFTISSPFFFNNWVKIHCRENKMGEDSSTRFLFSRSRFTFK